MRSTYRAAQHHKMEALLGEVEKRIEAVEVKQRAARAAAKAAEKAMKARHERDLAQLTAEREAIAEREAALSAREASARSLIADATKRFESARELMESEQVAIGRQLTQAQQRRPEQRLQPTARLPRQLSQSAHRCKMPPTGWQQPRLQQPIAQRQMWHYARR